MIQKLSLSKPGDQVQTLKLNLAKGARFSVELLWESDHDLDAHALLAVNDGNGAKVTDMGQILSTYNSKKTNRDGTLETNPDGTFSTPCGTLTHSGDKIPAKGATDPANETITVDSSKAPQGVNEIPFFVTIHEAKKNGATFAKVRRGGIRIVDDGGKVLGEYQLTDEFGSFNAVQMGALVLGEHGWEYSPIGAGFSGDFNEVLTQFA